MPVIYQNQIGFDGSISYRDGANLDAFGRLRVSTPHTLFDSHNEFGLDTYNEINSILKNNKEEQKDAIGDIMVVLTILSDQLGFDLFDCYDSAYEVIKNRQGTTIDGTFIKE